MDAALVTVNVYQDLVALNGDILSAQGDLDELYNVEKIHIPDHIHIIFTAQKLLPCADWID